MRQNAPYTHTSRLTGCANLTSHCARQRMLIKEKSFTPQPHRSCCKTSPSSSGQTKTACKWQHKNPCWSSCTDYSPIALRNRRSANIPGTLRKAHLLAPARGLELELVWGWELELVSGLVAKVEEREMAKGIPPHLGK